MFYPWPRFLLKFKLYLFYNDYETSYTTYINHARWHRCLRSDGLRVGRNRSAQRKPTCLTWWPHDHLTCRRWVSIPSRSVRGECVNTAPASQTDSYLIVDTQCFWPYSLLHLNTSNTFTECSNIFIDKFIFL